MHNLCRVLGGEWRKLACLAETLKWLLEPHGQRSEASSQDKMEAGFQRCCRGAAKTGRKRGNTAAAT